jgi:hypothetical protein
MLGEILEGVLLATFAFGAALFGGAVAVAAALIAGSPASGAFNGTVSDAPQAHLAFFPAIVGFQVKILPQPSQEKNLGSFACSIMHRANHPLGGGPI